MGFIQTQEYNDAYLTITTYENDDGWEVVTSIDPDRDDYYCIEAEQKSTQSFLSFYKDGDIYDETFSVENVDNMAGVEEVNQKIQTMLRLLDMRDIINNEIVPIVLARIENGV